jgi:hypothetical protein
MRSHNGSIDTAHTPPPLSFYNTFKAFLRKKLICAKKATKLPPLMVHFRANGMRNPRIACNADNVSNIPLRELNLKF